MATSKNKSEKMSKKRKHRTPSEERARAERKAAKKAAKLLNANNSDENGRSSKKLKKDHDDNKDNMILNTTNNNNNNNMNIDEIISGNNHISYEEKKDADGNLPIESFPLLDSIKEALKQRSITHLFPIQAKTLTPILNGKDIIGQARTGTGKTLAFTLPVVQQVLKNNVHNKRGRHPRVLVLAPTRELALQVSRDFESVASELETLTVYGGSPYRPQELAMHRGIDVVVGTTGRIKDHIERNNLKLDSIEHVILDEADEMLNMGFAEDVEFILKNIKDNNKDQHNIQTLLFSATVPDWVVDLSRRYLKADRIKVDMVKGQKIKAAKTVRHLLMQVHWTERNSVLADVISCYGGSGRTIVFTETKKDANEIALSGTIREECQVLHGDIAQSQREQTMKGFRDGNFNVLVATDVAARGLDVTGVDLVVQVEPPEKCETYIHRSGRTGRAGQDGVCIVFQTPKQAWAIQNIERRAGFKFENVGVPQRDDLIEYAIRDAKKAMKKVDNEVLTYFRDTAKEIMKDNNNAEDTLCRALAVMTGHHQPIQARSLLCAASGWITVQLHSKEQIRSLSFVWSQIRRCLFGPDCDAKVRGMRFAEDQMSALFDVPVNEKSTVEAAIEGGGKWVWWSIPTELPPMAPQKNAGQRPQSRRWGSRGSRGGDNRQQRSKSFGGGSRNHKNSRDRRFGNNNNRRH